MHGNGQVLAISGGPISWREGILVINGDHRAILSAVRIRPSDCRPVCTASLFFFGQPGCGKFVLGGRRGLLFRLCLGLEGCVWFRMFFWGGAHFFSPLLMATSAALPGELKMLSGQRLRSTELLRSLPASLSALWSR
jgi:hypothetical protein